MVTLPSKPHSSPHFTEGVAETLSLEDHHRIQVKTQSHEDFSEFATYRATPLTVPLPNPTLLPLSVCMHVSMQVCMYVCMYVEMGFFCVAQTGVELQGSRDPSCSTSQSARPTGLSHWAYLHQCKQHRLLLSLHGCSTKAGASPQLSFPPLQARSRGWWPEKKLFPAPLTVPASAFWPSCDQTWGGPEVGPWSLRVGGDWDWRARGRVWELGMRVFWLSSSCPHSSEIFQVRAQTPPLNGLRGWGCGPGFS